MARKRAVATRYQSTSQGAIYNRETTKAYRQTPRGRAGLLLWFAERRAKDCNIEFSLSVEPIVKAIELGHCEVTGISFDMKPVSNKHHTNPWAPSLDRRDSLKGYTPDNVQVVCAAYNYAKSEWSEDVLLTLARAIVDKSYTEA